MGAAHLLADTNHVTLFETEKRLGGHARTRIAGKNGDQPVDTGFIVFNYANYPHLTALFETLDVPVAKSNMSFGVSIDGGRMEYALNSLDSLFAQRRHVMTPAFLRMVRDLFRFNARASAAAQDPAMTVGQLLDSLGMGDWFRRYYLLPFSGAIWSTPTEQIMDFPAYAMVRFFENHALLNHTGQHQWYTVAGGSQQYVDRLQASMAARSVDIRLGATVSGVRRSGLSPEVRTAGGDWERFDEVVFATHSDDTLALLSDASARERDLLGAIRYQPNQVVLHADATLMPKRRKCWASWVYTEDRNARSDVIDVTYWMNSLQPIPMDDPHFVTLNTKRPIREELIYDEVTLHHPVYDLGALQAQEKLRSLNGTNRTWFCGAWMKNGFHEDGLSSAVDVVEGLRRARALEEAAA
jgi:predicted NAD/FAD-binding protein